ncbi:hypothetical protein [Aurantimonas coralicida]|uniref:hypothetical protein n=1 Tax=Aurantimonas coralicida TaxID=182270 RepID=UPI00239FE6E0|nr:hypothetical protein [Aurantimonas coralicida]MDE0921491.1 hypothetical protein [Aurantimonas coralicida]
MKLVLRSVILPACLAAIFSGVAAGDWVQAFAYILVALGAGLLASEDWDGTP